MAKWGGSIWVEGNSLHYIDYFSREWRIPGIYVGIPTAGARAGSIWIDFDYRLHFINYDGLGHFIVDIQLVKTTPGNASWGSLWIDTVDHCLHWVAPLIPPYYDNNVRAHTDIAYTATHTDTHTDGGHGDTAHSDVAHTDLTGHNDHDDTHSDVSHGDSHTDTHGDDHGDTSPATHQDHNDHLDHSDSPTHFDLTKPHTDYHHSDSHNDQHSDVAHSDRAHTDSHVDHNDTDAHTDVPHSNIAHVDAAHQDSHDDTHGDTPHSDQPILIGP